MDQVLRLEQFRQARPDVDIQHRRTPAWHWEAVWRGPDDATMVVTDYELGGLLNRVEAALLRDR
jgi:hypothetical protein